MGLSVRVKRNNRSLPVVYAAAINSRSDVHAATVRAIVVVAAADAFVVATAAFVVAAAAVAVECTVAFQILA